MQNNPTQPQEPRTRLDYLASLLEITRQPWTEDIDKLIALAVACRDAQDSLEEVGYPVILEALAPLLKPVDKA